MPRKMLIKKICAWCGNEFYTKHMHQETCSKSHGVKLFKKRELEKYKVFNVWACGGGVQSTAIAALIYTEKLPKPDFTYMIDCGYEKTSTFKYCEKVLIPKLREIGVILNIVKTLDYTDNDLFGAQGSMKLPLYLNQNGIVKRLSTRCSDTWKNRVASKWLREKGVKRCNTWIGISLDENRRVKNSRTKWNQNKYPLVDIGIRREDCIYMVARLGWPQPDHTCCYLCPNQTDLQWKTLKEEYSQDFYKAINIEQNIRKKNPNMFLHRSCKPLSDIEFN